MRADSRELIRAGWLGERLRCGTGQGGQLGYDDGHHHGPIALDVLTVRGEHIAEVTAFRIPARRKPTGGAGSGDTSGSEAVSVLRGNQRLLLADLELLDAPGSAVGVTEAEERAAVVG